MRPIPKQLLIHTAKISTPEQQDAWQSVTYSEPITLEHVRIEPCRKLVLESDNTQRQQTATLFFDVVNSLPADFEFTEGQRVEALGQIYQVLMIEPLYDEQKLHHYEVGLE